MGVPTFQETAISCTKPMLFSGDVFHSGRVLVRFFQAPKSDEDAKAGVAVQQIPIRLDLRIVTNMATLFRPVWILNSEWLRVIIYMII